MNQVGDIIVGFAALVIAASLVLYPNAPSPRPKPEPPAPPIQQPCDPKAQECPIGPAVTIRAAPLTDEQKQQQDMKKAKIRLEHVERQAKRIDEKLEALEAVGNEPNGQRN